MKRLTEVRCEGSNGGWVTAMDGINDGIQVVVIQHLNVSLRSIPSQHLFITQFQIIVSYFSMRIMRIRSKQSKQILVSLKHASILTHTGQGISVPRQKQ